MNGFLKTGLIGGGVVFALAAIGSGLLLCSDPLGFGSASESAWKIERQEILSESRSPDSSLKVGAYHYDRGGMGYTAIQVSLVAATDTYPLKANLYAADNIPARVMWSGDTSVVFEVHPDYRKSAGIEAPPSDTAVGRLKINYRVYRP